MPDMFPGQNPAEFIEKIQVRQNASVTVASAFNPIIIDTVHVRDLVYGVIIPDPLRFNIGNSVTVSQIVSFDIFKAPITSTVKVGQAVKFSIERTINLIDNLTIKQYVVPWIDNRVSGNRGDVFTDPIVVAYQDGLVKPTNVTFTTENTSITLRKPEFGDTNNYQQYRVQRNTLGGDLKIYHDAMWPIYEKFDLHWDYMSNEDATALLIFLQATEGQKMTFHTHFGETFPGYIITPFQEILQPKVRGWSASFTFQIYEDPNPVNSQ